MTLILLNGPAQIGKSTIANHLCENHGWGFLDAGTPFKCLLGFGRFFDRSETSVWGQFEAFANYRKTFTLDQTLSFIEDNQEELLACYEVVKSFQKDDVRDACISIAELVRCFDPDFWVKAAIRIAPNNQNLIGFVLDPVEYLAFCEYYHGQLEVVQLVCVDAPNVTDTRQPLSDGDISEQYHYCRNDSLLIAEQIAKTFGPKDAVEARHRAKLDNFFAQYGTNEQQLFKTLVAILDDDILSPYRVTDEVLRKILEGDKE